MGVVAPDVAVEAVPGVGLPGVRAVSDRFARMVRGGLWRRAHLYAGNGRTRPSSTSANKTTSSSKGTKMPKQSPIPDEVDKPFFDAANEDCLVLQYCATDDRWQYPPKPECAQCGSADHLSWRQVNGDGAIYSYAVVYDTPVASLQPDQPFNVAVIELDEAPGVVFLSHLPGTAVDEVPIGGRVKLIFEKTLATGQKVPEWQIV